MRKIILALIAIVALAVPANAASYLFSVDLRGTAGALQPAYSFTIDSDPIPDGFEASPGFSYFKIAGVAITADPAYAPAPASPADLLFFDQITGGAFSTADFVTISYFGTQLFSGPVDAPTFLLGTTDLYDWSGDVVGTITVANAQSAVPELMIWALMAGGMGLVGGVIRRERRFSEPRSA